MNLPVLMYHELRAEASGMAASDRPYILAVARFEEQLAAMRSESVLAQRLDQFLDTAEGSGGAGRRCVITFDDGHESDLTLALPALATHGFTATFFVTAGWMGRPGYLSWGQVRDLAGAGMEIGSHSMTHRPPASLSEAELRAEMSDSRRLIEDRIGAPIRTASSPTGFFNAELPRIVREAGYDALCCGRIGLWDPSQHRFDIPRVPIKPQVDAVLFLRILAADPQPIARLRRSQMLRNGLKRALGVRTYLRFREFLLRRIIQ